MPKYLVQANYVGEGISGLLKEGGVSRRAAVQKLADSLSVKIEAFYYAFGETDLFLIVEAPDQASAVAMSLTASASGLVTTKLTVLLEPEEIDRAGKLSPQFRPVGS